MPREEYLKRTKQIYFGEEGDDRLTKQQVGEFISNQMGLVRSDGKVKWTEGILELVECGMDNFEDAVQPTDPEIIEELEEARERIDDLEQENEMLKRQLQSQQVDTTHVKDPERKTHLIECRILEVLCRQENRGRTGNPQFTDPTKVAKGTGLKLETVNRYLGIMSEPHVDLIEEEGNRDRVKASKGFEEHCEDTGIDPDRVRDLNDKKEGV
jgi:hypothetical protein